MRTLLIFLFISISSYSLGQKEYQIPLEGFVSYDSKSEPFVHDGDYLLTIKIDKDGLMKYNRKKGQRFSSGEILDKTESYLTVQMSETGYLFFDIEDKLLYTIDRFKDRYITTGYGKDIDKVKQMTIQINQWQQSGKAPEKILAKLKEQLLE